jgi:hypothetical protein
MNLVVILNDFTLKVYLDKLIKQKKFKILKVSIKINEQVEETTSNLK